MTNLITLNPPSLDVQLDGSGFYATKGWLQLEHAALRFDGFPDDAEIVRAWIWSQQMADYPSGCYGDITWYVAPPLYVALSGVPAQERCQPIGSGYLGRLLFRPGADQECHRQFRVSVPFPPGSKIGLAPEITGAPNRFLSIFTGLDVWSDTGFTELPGIVYHDLPNKSTAAAGAYSWRCTMSDIPAGGTEVRVTVAALADGLQLDHMSIGVRSGSSGFNMTAAPVPVTFGGAGALTLPAFGYARSDWVSLTTAAHNALLVHSCVTDVWAFKDCAISDGNPGAYVTGTSGYNTQNFSGTLQRVNQNGVTDPNGAYHRKHVVAMVEVR